MTNNTKVTNVCYTNSTKGIRVRPITHVKAMSQSEQTVTKQFRLMVLLQFQVDGTIINACIIPQTIGPQSLCQELTLEQMNGLSFLERGSLADGICHFRLRFMCFFWDSMSSNCSRTDCINYSFYDWNIVLCSTPVGHEMSQYLSQLSLTINPNNRPSSHERGSGVSPPRKF